jgi:hypothetical protein
VGTIRIGATLGITGMLVLCIVPWSPWLIVLAIILLCWSGPAGLAFSVLIVKRYQQRQQAQVQGLLEVAALISMGAAVPFWTHVLYDECADTKGRQALPFFIGWAFAFLGGIVGGLAPLAAFERGGEVATVVSSSA